jgi:hypothetical protein
MTNPIPKPALSQQPVRDPRRTAVIFGVTCILVLFLNAAWLTRYHHIYAGVPVLCSVVGDLIGWALAVLATPAGEKEGLQFNAYAKVVSGFLSGILFTKLNDLVSVGGVKNFLRKSDNLAQFGYAGGYALAFFLIGLMWTFLVRRYAQARGDVSPEAQTPSREPS